MIYIDPPYGIKFGSNWQVSARKRDVKDGKLEDASREVEQIKAFRDTWELGIHSYLTYLRDRLDGREGPADRERLVSSCRSATRTSTSCASLMDEVFGSENFVSSDRVRRRPAELIRRRRLPRSPTTSSGTRKDASAVKYRQLYRRRSSSEATAGAVHAGSSSPTERVGRLTHDERDEPLRRGAAVPRRQPDVAEPASADTMSRSSSRVGRITPGRRRAGRPTRRAWSGSLRPAGVIAHGEHSGYVRYLDDFPAMPLHERLGRHGRAGRSATTRSTSSRPNAKVIERCMLMTTDPGRPRPRPDLRLGHDGLRRRAVGPALDHDRHVPGRARARAPAAHGRAVPVLPARRLRRRAARRRASCSATPLPPAEVDRRHSPRLRLRAGAAHHAEVDREQPGHRRGHEPRGDRRGDPAACRVRAALRQAVRGQEEGSRLRAVHGREPVAAPLARVRRQRGR